MDVKSVLIEELKRLQFYAYKGEPIENLSTDELKQLVATARLKEDSVEHITNIGR